MLFKFIMMVLYYLIILVDSWLDIVSSIGFVEYVAEIVFIILLFIFLIYLFLEIDFFFEVDIHFEIWAILKYI